MHGTMPSCYQIEHGRNKKEPFLSYYHQMVVASIIIIIYIHKKCKLNVNLQ